jgi:hypothetical protein
MFFLVNAKITPISFCNPINFVPGLPASLSYQKVRKDFQEEQVEVELDEGKRRLVVRTVSGTKEEFPWVWLRLYYS